MTSASSDAAPSADTFTQPASAGATRAAHPLALEHVHFPFRALAGFAARAPLGGRREAGIACFVAARLANELLAPRPLAQPVRTVRAVAARAWLASLAMPAVLRVPLARLVDATGGELGPAGRAIGEIGEIGDAHHFPVENGERPQFRGAAGVPSPGEATRSRAAAAAASLAAAARGHLDGPARLELEQLARAMAEPPARGVSPVAPDGG